MLVIEVFTQSLPLTKLKGQVCACFNRIYYQQNIGYFLHNYMLSACNNMLSACIYIDSSV